MNLRQRNIASHRLETEASTLSALSRTSDDHDHDDAAVESDDHDSTERTEGIPEDDGPPSSIYFMLVYGLFGLVFGGFYLYVQQARQGWIDMYHHTASVV